MLHKQNQLWLLKVGLFLMTGLVVVWGLAFLEIAHNNDQESLQVEQRVSSRAHIFGEYTSSTIKRVDEILLDTRQYWNGDWTAFAKYIEMKQANIGDITFQIAIIDKDGLLVFSNLAPATERTDLSQREHFLVHKDGPGEDKLFISKPLIGKVSKKWSIQFTRPIFKRDRFAGVIVASLNPKHFGQFAKNLHVNEGDVISIFRDSGERMARYPLDEDSYGQKLGDLPFLRADAPISGTFKRFSAFDGIERLYGYYRLPDYGLSILSGESTVIAGIPAREYRSSILLGASAISILMLLLALLIWRRGIEKQKSDEALQIASMVYKNSSESMFITDKDGLIIAVNAAFTRLTGYAAEEVIGNTPHILSSGLQDEGFWKNFWNELNSTGCWKGEVQNRHKSGETYIEELIVDTIYPQGSKDCFRVALFHDVTQNKHNQETIFQQANFDGLTGLPNRRLFVEKLSQEVSRSQRNNFKLALIFLDLDHFKDVNDSLGHPVGDQLLIAVGERLCQAVRQVDTVSRLGGDEFTVILSLINQPLDAELVAQKILDQLSLPFVLEGGEVYIAASLGIAICPDDAVDADSLIRYADQAMYVSKEAGRNRYTFFSSAMQDEATRRMKLVKEMHVALKEEQWEVHYQPIVELKTGGVHKAEALIRWRHPVHGLLQPREFVPLAEEMGLIQAIDDWLLKKVCEDLKALEAVLDGDFEVSINRSAREFKSVNNYIEKLEGFGIPLNRIVLEITEGVLMDESTTTAENIQRLHQAGVKFALDDFGTGYSSMSYLRRFPVTYLKIDQSFVGNLHKSNSKDNALCESIITLAHKLGAKVIAEGVETIEQRDWLYVSGCNYVQGYFYFHPISAALLYEVLAAQKASSSSL